MPSLAAEVRAKASALGFSAVGFAPVEHNEQQAGRLDFFLGQGWQGDMEWMLSTADRRRSPVALWPDARTAVMVTMHYPAPADAFGRLDRRTSGVIAAYALGRDYHDVMKGRLKHLAQWFARRSGSEVKVFVDTAPLMEKPLAQRGGLGWQGKHTNLVSRAQGSWFFLGAMLTTARIEDGPPEIDHCGSCRACLDICPTDAFPAPYQLDARRCIAYLTIEHRGPIPLEFRKPMGNRIYGCDDCLAVCPWNKFAKDASEAKLAADAGRIAPPLAELASLGDDGFRKRFAGSAIKRTGWKRFLRNILVALGNSGDPDLLTCVRPHLRHDDAVVRGAAVWALRQLAPAAVVEAEAHAELLNECDAQVREEWTRPA
jgi:epoxyqueuosine reductase